LFVRGVVAHVLNKVAYVGMSDGQFQRAVRGGMRPHEVSVVEFGSVAKIHWPHMILWQGPIHFHYSMWSKYFLQQSQNLS
jgi:hypothetical protein